MPEISVPLDWSPRPYQKPLWDALEGGCRRAVAVWHRRAGKDTVALNWIVTQIFQRPGLYWHTLPTYRQGKKIIWDGINHDGRRFLSHFPEETIARRRDDEMSLWFKGVAKKAGSQFQVIGAETKEDVDKLVGTNPLGVVFSEYSLSNPLVWDYVRPILAENGGWALFIYTPRGRNHGYQMFRRAKENADWFCEVLTVDDTNAITQEAIELERRSGMSEALIQQEFYCSWDAPLEGAYYAEAITAMEAQERITKVPWEPNKTVWTGWDLGYGDSTAIWFAQMVSGEPRLIDYYEASGKAFQHFAGVLKEGYRSNYVYERHLAPHDAKAHWMGTGTTIEETARSLGVKLKVLPKQDVEDGIQAVRALLMRAWADEKKCERGLQALREYTKERIEGMEDPDGKPVFRDKPSHSWASNGADALRTLAQGMRERRAAPTKLAPDLAIA